MQNCWNQNVEREGSPLRSYCHPVDAEMIHILDNPVSRIVIGKLVDIGAEVSYGQMIASAVPITEENEPELNAILEDCSGLLRNRKPYMVLSNAAGFNAFTIGSDKKPYIVLGAMLVKCMTTEQMRFVIGHECGHVAMGHMVYHTAANVLAQLAKDIPVVGAIADTAVGFALKAWSRRSEITADRAGMLCCGNKETAVQALLQIESEFVDARRLNAQAYVQDSREYRNGSVIRRLGEFGSDHPLTSKRMECLDLFDESSLLFRIFGEEPPEGAMNDRDLRNRVENVLRVL